MVQIAYRASHIMLMLGVSRSTYNRIINEGLLPSTRLYPGGPRVHLPEHVRAYEEYLREQTIIREKRKR